MGKFVVLEEMKRRAKIIKSIKITAGVQVEEGKNVAGDPFSGSDIVDPTAKKPINYITLANVHEYGMDIEVTDAMRWWFRNQGVTMDNKTTHVHIPERSFVRTVRNNISFMKERQQEFNNAVLKYLKLKIDDKQFEYLVEQVGLAIVTKIVADISQNQKPLTDFTKEQKKKTDSSNPSSSNVLVGTGQLINHITYVVHKKGD